MTGSRGTQPRVFCVGAACIHAAQKGRAAAAGTVV